MNKAIYSNNKIPLSSRKPRSIGSCHSINDVLFWVTSGSHRKNMHYMMSLVWYSQTGKSNGGNWKEWERIWESLYVWFRGKMERPVRTFWGDGKISVLIRDKHTWMC